MYDSLFVTVASGITEMKEGITPITGAILGLVLFLTGITLVITMVRARKPKAVN